MWIDYELARGAGVEVLVAFGRLVELDHPSVDDLAIGRRVPKIACMSCRLYLSTGVWPVCNSFDFAQAVPKARTEIAVPGRRFLGARIAGDIETRNAGRSTRPRATLSLCRRRILSWLRS
jgi:hypothetical protein